MDALAVRVAARYAASLVTPEYLDKLVGAPGLASNAPDAVRLLQQLAKSLTYGGIAPFPVGELGNYLRGRDVPEDEIALALAVKVRAPRTPKTIDFTDALIEFGHVTGASVVPDMRFAHDPKAGEAVLDWLAGWKRLKPLAKKVWAETVKKVYLEKPRDTEDASWTSGGIHLDVSRTADPKVRATQMTHELGHAFEEHHHLGGFDPPWGQAPFISDYAEFKPNVEDIAESFQAYVNEPALLRRKCPEKFEALRALV